MREQIGFSKDYGHGILGKVVQDEDGGEPPDGNNDYCKIAILHRRYKNPCKGLLDTPDEVAAFAKQNPGWHEFPLYLYDHSGTVYRVSQGGNPFTCPWDSGRVGSLFVNKKEAGGYRKKGAAALRFQSAQSIIQEYTDWANGNIWGYVIYSDDDDHLDSCWGFIGNPDSDHIVESMDAAADYHIAQAQAQAEADLTCAARQLEASRPDLYP